MESATTQRPDCLALVDTNLTPEEKVYLKNHPEIPTILNGYLKHLLSARPKEVYLDSKTYFADLAVIPHLKPLVLAGPSGVGKGTILKRLLAQFPQSFKFSVSYATRAARPGETNGIEYCFVSIDEFKSEIAKGGFIEYCEVHGNFYGTNQKFVDGVMREGKICLLEIDIQGCEKVYASQLECNYIFIDPPSFEALKARLAQRGTETPEQVARRLTTAENELKRVKDLSYFTHILNDDLDTCYKMVVEQLNTWYPSLKLSVPKS